MNITIFVFFIALGLTLSVLAYLIRGNLGLGLAFIGAGIFMVVGMAIGNGETITSTVYFDTTTFTTHVYDLGISATNIMIFFILIGILDIMTAVSDWLR